MQLSWRFHYANLTMQLPPEACLSPPVERARQSFRRAPLPKDTGASRSARGTARRMVLFVMPKALHRA